MKELQTKLTLDYLSKLTDVNTYNGAFDATQILSAALLTILSDDIVINRVQTPVKCDYIITEEGIKSTKKEANAADASSSTEDNSTTDAANDDDDIIFNFGFDNNYYKNSKAIDTGITNVRGDECEYITYFTYLWRDLGGEKYGTEVRDILLKGICLELDKRYEASIKEDDKQKDENYAYKKDTSNIFDLLESFNPLWNEEDYNTGLSADSYDEKFEDTIDFAISVLDREIVLAESEAQRIKEIQETIDIESIKNDSILLFERYVPLKGYFSGSSDAEGKNDNGKYAVAIYPKEEPINSNGEIDKENGEDSTVYYVYAIPDSKSSWGWVSKATQANKIRFSSIEYASSLNFAVGYSGCVYAFPDATEIKELEKYKISNGISKLYNLNDIAICSFTPDGTTEVFNTIVVVGNSGSIFTHTSSGEFTEASADTLKQIQWKQNMVYNMTHYHTVSYEEHTIINGDNTNVYHLFIAGGENGFIEYGLSGTNWVMDRGPNKNIKDIIHVSSGGTYMLFEDGSLYSADVS